MINTICLYKNEGDGKLYLQVNWNDGIAYIQADQTSGRDRFKFCVNVKN